MSVFSRGLHKVLKKTAYGRTLERNYAMAYGDKLMPSVINQPDVYYDSLRGKIGGSRKKASRAEALAKTAYVRTMVGPEVNFMLGGIPFLLFAAVGTIKAEIREAKAAKAPKSTPAPRGEGTGIKLKMKTNPADLQATPLPSRPHSANFVPVRQELVNLGMNPDTATAFVNGEFDDSVPLELQISEADGLALLSLLEKYS